MSERIFYPSAKHVGKLRTEGKVPFSKLTNFIVAASFTAVFVIFSMKDYIFLLKNLSEINKISELKYNFLSLLFIPNAIFFFCYFLMQLVQTKFLLIPVRLDLARLIDFNRWNYNFLLNIVLSFLTLVAGLALGIYFFKSTTPLLLGLLNSDHESREQILKNLFAFGIFKYLACLCFVAFFSWRIAIYNFMISNKMTKREVEAEES